MHSKPLSTKLPINLPSSGFQVPYNLSDEYILENEIDSNYFDIFRGILKNKRESKKLRKIHEEMFEIYVSSLDYVDIKRIKGYCRIISKFLVFSPSVDPDDLELFFTTELNKNKRATL